MKKIGLLNQPLASMIASMGHADMLVIGDAGLPIPKGPKRIDLAVTDGVPPFMPVLAAVLTELEVEKAIIDEESIQRSPEKRAEIIALLLEHNIPYESVPHAQLQAQVPAARAVVRTGEYTPYCNIILIAGVVF